MQRDFVDFAHVPDNQRSAHDALLNWERWVTPRNGKRMHPMWRQSRSNAWQWHAPEIRVPVDTIFAMQVEKQVCQLPDPHRQALVWCYVVRCNPIHARNVLHVTNEGLYRLVSDARIMLRNRMSL